MQEKHYLVYKTTNLVNGKIYIGKHETDNLYDGYLGSGKILKKAIEKYGEENFKREILFECSSREEMNAKEAELVNEEFLKRDDVYNLKQGGEGGFDFIIKNNLHKNPQSHSIGGKAFAKRLKEDAELKKKLSNRLRAEWKNPKRYIKFKEYLKSKKRPLCKHHTEETKRKISIANSLNHFGENNANYGNRWVSDMFNEICYTQNKSIPLEEYQVAARIQDFKKYKLKQAEVKLAQVNKIEHQKRLKELRQTFFSAFYDEYLKTGFKSMCQKFGVDFEISAFLHLCKKRVAHYAAWNRWKNNKRFIAL